MVTYGEVIRDIMRMRPNHKEISCSDCMVSKQNFRAFEKLTHHMSHGIGPMSQVSGHGRPTSCWRTRRY